MDTFQHASPTGALGPSSPPEAQDPSPRGERRSIVGRAIWAVMAAAALALFAVGFPARLAQLHRSVANFSPPQMAVLLNLGIRLPGDRGRR